MMAKTRSTTKRDLVDTGTDTRYVKRTAGGRFKEADDVTRSLSADRRRPAKTAVKSGHGDQGDRRPTETAARKRTAKKR
jgi:hypothetical protein